MEVGSGDLNTPHSMGTTIIGVTCDDGVVLGANSRTSTGMYVANRASDKITQLTDNVYISHSGSARIYFGSRFTDCVRFCTLLSPSTYDTAWAACNCESCCKPCQIIVL